MGLSEVDKDRIAYLEKWIEEIREDATRLARREEVAAKLNDYYDAIADIQDTSSFLHTLTYEVSNEASITDVYVGERLGDKWNKIKGVWPFVERRVVSAITKLKGLPAWAGAHFLSAFDRVRKTMADLVSQGKQFIINSKDQIIEAFHTVSDMFKGFILGLIEKMFEFLAQVGAIAEEKGFVVSETDVKLPTMNFEGSLFGLHLPIPTIVMPEFNMTIEPKRNHKVA